MWPFSVTRGLAGRRPSALPRPTAGISSVAGGVHTIPLNADAAGAPNLWSQRLTDLFLYWKAKRAGRPFPGRADIDPLDIPALLPIVFLVDVAREPANYRFRLAGSEFARKYGADPTGRTLEQVNRHAHAEAIFRDYATCATEATPVASRNSFLNDKGVFWKYERVLMPLGDAPGRAAMILGGMDINIPLDELSKLEAARSGNSAGRSAGHRPAGWFSLRPR